MCKAYENNNQIEPSHELVTKSPGYGARGFLVSPLKKSIVLFEAFRVLFFTKVWQPNKSIIDFFSPYKNRE